MLNVDDTICAIASARGGAYRGIVRISGPETIRLLQQCLSIGGDPLSSFRFPLSLAGSLRLPDPFGPIDCGLLLWPTTRSYTRQLSAELHTIGSPPLLDAILRHLCGQGMRLAEPGEFTLRAFLAGRLDLTQAEAVLAVIDAQDRSELQVALKQLAGGIAAPLDRLRERLLDLLAQLEAGLDFVEEDIEFISTADLRGELSAVELDLATIRQQLDSRTAAEDRTRVVLVGCPNVGKSSLMNALTGAEALVSDKAGTTRDYVTVEATFGETRCLLIDTAGIERDQDAGGVAHEAQNMTALQADQAQIELLCLDGSRALNDWEWQRLSETANGERLIVLTKTDLPGSSRSNLPTPAPDAVIATSSRSGQGLDQLRTAIGQVAGKLSHAETSVVGNTAGRCADSLRRACESVARARQSVDEATGEELVAAELRSALEDLGRIVGAVYADDVLDRIFSRFCIGK